MFSLFCLSFFVQGFLQNLLLINVDSQLKYFFLIVRCLSGIVTLAKVTIRCHCGNGFKIVSKQFCHNCLNVSQSFTFIKSITWNSNIMHKQWEHSGNR